MTKYFPRVGDWVRWLTSTKGQEGQVVEAAWPSFTVRWVGVDEPQVFPLGFLYFTGEQSSMSMEPITPKKKLKAVAIDSTPKGRAMTVREAAGALDTTPRAIRMKLRAGKLKGLQRDGRWVEVYL